MRAKIILDNLIGAQRSARLLSFIQEQRYLQKYYNRKVEMKKGFEGLVFMCDGKIHHGGLSDRLRGMVSMFIYCQNESIPYRIYFCHPFNLQDYLIPNECKWSINSNELCYNIEISQPVIIRPYSERDDVDTTDYIKKRLQSYGPYRQLHVYSNITLEKENFKKAFDALFKPSEALEQQLIENTGAIGEKYISISFRFQSLLGDFRDINSNPLHPDERFQLMNKCIGAIETIKEENPSINKVLITSDSATFLKEAQSKLEYVVEMAGEVGHIDNSTGKQYGQMRTFIDMMMIARAEKAYVYATGAMYKNSSFAETSALIGGVPFRKIVE